MLPKTCSYLYYLSKNLGTETFCIFSLAVMESGRCTCVDQHQAKVGQCLCVSLGVTITGVQVMDVGYLYVLRLTLDPDSYPPICLVPVQPCTHDHQI